MIYGLFESTDLQTFFEALAIFLLLFVVGIQSHVFIKNIFNDEYNKTLIDEAKKERQEENPAHIFIQTDNTTDTPHAPVDADSTGELSDSTQGDNKT